MARKVKKQGYIGFNKLKGELAHRPGVTNPGALAAYIGKKKYGSKAMQQHAALGKGFAPRKKRFGKVGKTYQGV